MADTPKHSRGSHFASPSTGSNAANAQPAAQHTVGATQRSGARFKTNAAASSGATSRAARTSTAPSPSSSTGMVSMATPRSREQRQAAARGGHSAKGAILGVIVGIAIVAVAVMLITPRLSALLSGTTETVDDVSTLANQGQEVSVIIEDGSGAYDVAALLKENGLIVTQDGFVSAMVEKGADSKLKSGAYVFTIGQDYDTILGILVGGSNSTANTFTIPEGRTLTQTAATVEEALGISADEFIAQAKASNYVADYSFLEAAAANSEYDSLEGYLYPKTYDLSMVTDVTADTVIRAMLDQYQAEVQSLDFASAEAAIQEKYGVEMSDYDMLILASIVEREAVTDSQRYDIASTFFNRLKIGMALQSDATYMYITGGEVTMEDLENDQSNPYNTRFNAGLTPTPICSPSLESIQATLAPNDTDYLYFYITSDYEKFSATYDEHLAAQAEAAN